MAEPAADVEGIIQAAGLGARLGLGPKAFVMVAGTTLLERAVATMLAIAPRVTVAVREEDVASARDLVGRLSVTVIAGGMRRTDTLRALVNAAKGPWLVLHDVVHPFVTVDLVRRVLEQARGAGAAAAALPNVDFIYRTNGELLAAPGECVAIQKPVVFTRASALRGLGVAARSALQHEVGVLQILALASQPVTFVPGLASNGKLTTAEDLALAQCLALQADPPQADRPKGKANVPQCSGDHG